MQSLSGCCPKPKASRVHRRLRPNQRGRVIRGATPSCLPAAAEQLPGARGHRRKTLTTFRDVPRNGPYYTRLRWSTICELA